MAHRSLATLGLVLALTACNPMTDEDCAANTCEALGAACGTVDDGCGGVLRCGGCPDGQACSDNGCVGDCVPESCQTLSLACGSASDGCGGTLECGACECRFSAQEIPAPEGFTQVRGAGLNRHGAVVANGRPSQGQDKPFVYWPDGRLERLGVWEAPDDSRLAQALNDQGQVAGHDNFYAGGTGAFVWNAGTHYPLSGLPFCPELDGQDDPYPQANALDINNLGTAVGSSGIGNCGEDAVWWTDGVPHALPGLRSGAQIASAAAISDSGIIVGHSWDDQGRNHAVRWRDSQIEDLGVVAHPYAGAVDVNERGDMAIENGEGAARVLLADGPSRTLRQLSPDEVARPSAINASGAVVGASTPSSRYTGRAVLWREEAPLDLNLAVDRAEFIGTFERAVAVDDELRILVDSDAGQAYLLTPNQACLKGQ